MNSDLSIRPPLPRTLPQHVPACPIALSYQVAARMANVAWTAQVQIAHACAIAAGESAERTAACIEQAWPNTPLRLLVVQAYRAQARVRRDAAGQVLARARKRCGLAFARLYP